MDYYFFLFLFLTGFTAIILRFKAGAPSFFSIVGAILLIFAGLTIFTDGNITTPDSTVNRTIIENYSYNWSVPANNTIWLWSCIDANGTQGNVTYNGSEPACLAGYNITGTVQIEELQVPTTWQIITDVRETRTFNTYSGTFVNAFALILVLIGLAFILSAVFEK